MLALGASILSAASDPRIHLLGYFLCAVAAKVPSKCVGQPGGLTRPRTSEKSSALMQESALKKENDAAMTALAEEKGAAPLEMSSTYATKHFTQYKWLARKFTGIYWHSPEYSKRAKRTPGCFIMGVKMRWQHAPVQLF
jgi:hypothetical protein